MKLKPFSTFTSMLVLALLMVLLPSGSGAAAEKLAPAGGTIAYSGRLSDDVSQPVADGLYAFTFALHDAADGGNLLWSETQTKVAVKGGAFSVQLGSATPLPATARIGQGWLAVSVRGPGEMDFTSLSPRQPLNTAAVASASLASGPSCPHDHFGEAWIGDSTGTPNFSGFTVQDTATNGKGIEGISLASIGAMGYSNTGTGVWGYSSSGYAMVAAGNAKQGLTSGGWVKAMARVSGTNVTRCYNSQLSGTIASTPPCQITASDSSGTYLLTFGFQVDDRFISITPEWATAGTVPSAVVDAFPAANEVKIRVSQNAAFFIIVY